MSQENNSKLPIGRVRNPCKTSVQSGQYVAETAGADNLSVDRESTSTPDISKSQRKRDALAIRELAIAIAELSSEERARLPLPHDIEKAIDALSHITAHGARKRQLGFVAKCLRRVDTHALEQALAQQRLAARAHVELEHCVERWRKRLLGMDAESQPGKALSDFLTRYPGADRQHLRQLQRQALAERSAGRAPRASRKLFRELRSVLSTHRLEARESDAHDGETGMSDP